MRYLGTAASLNMTVLEDLLRLCGMGCLMTGLQTCKSYRMPDVRYRDEIPRRFFLFSISLWIIMPATSCLCRDTVHLAGSH